MKKCFFGLLLLLFLPLFLCSCTGKDGGTSSYKIDLVYDQISQTIVGEENFCFVNSYDNSFKNLMFHLYPNAFREGAKNKVVSLANHDAAYPNGESFGGIEVEQVLQNGEELKFDICGEDKNILNIELENEIFPNEKVEVCIFFKTTLPNINHRFGYGENTTNIANFYPVLCAYEDGVGFATDLYISNGDPFYSEVANYEVSVEYDKGLVLASTGEKVVSSKNGEKVVEKFSANKVRDFAMVFSSKFQEKSEKINDFEVKYFYYDDADSNETLVLATKCMKFFCEKFGQYPYSQISIVQSNFVYGGMEYPNIVLISDKLSKESAQYVIAHELAHQWWYGVVGNNQYKEAWVDEGITEYSTVLFFENHSEYGFDYKTMVTNANSSFKFFYDIYKKVCGEVDTRMARALNEFDTEPEYIHSTYTAGVILYDSLRELVGEKKLYACMKKYYEKMSYKVASGADLISIFSSVCGKNLEKFFDSFLQGKVIIN